MTQNGLLPDGERIYAIGDIHGHRDLLDRLLAKIAAHAASAPRARSTLVFLGDYVDRGPDTRGVIDCLTGPMPFVDRTVHLMGNHEHVMLGFIADAEKGAHWLSFGGVETLASYGIAVGREAVDHRALRRQLIAALPDRHATFLRNLDTSLRMDGYFFAHAGVRPGVPLASQSPDDLIWIRQPFLTSDADFGAVVVHGHTPAPMPDIRPNRINIDTGAYATGCLTCAILEGRHLSFLDTMSPDERIVY